MSMYIGFCTDILENFCSFFIFAVFVRFYRFTTSFPASSDFRFYDF